MDVVKLSDEQAAEVLVLERATLVAKAAVCDLQEQVVVLERKRAELYDEVYKARGAYMAKIEKLALLAGVDLEKEKWTFFQDVSEFRRQVDSPPTPAP